MLTSFARCFPEYRKKVPSRGECLPVEGYFLSLLNKILYQSNDSCQATLSSVWSRLLYCTTEEVLTFKSRDEILECVHSNESYRAVSKPHFSVVLFISLYKVMWLKSCSVTIQSNESCMLSGRLRVRAHTGAKFRGDETRGERQKLDFQRSLRIASPHNFALVRVCISPGPQSPSPKIGDYSQSCWAVLFCGILFFVRNLCEVCRPLQCCCLYCIFSFSGKEFYWALATIRR